jgi:hypothetical protein
VRYARTPTGLHLVTVTVVWFQPKLECAHKFQLHLPVYNFVKTRSVVIEFLHTDKQTWRS